MGIGGEDMKTNTYKATIEIELTQDFEESSFTKDDINQIIIDVIKDEIDDDVKSKVEITHSELIVE